MLEIGLSPEINRQEIAKLCFAQIGTNAKLISKSKTLPPPDFQQSSSKIQNIFSESPEVQQDQI